LAPERVEPPEVSAVLLKAGTSLNKSSAVLLKTSAVLIGA